MPELTGSVERIDLGLGYALTAPGLRGQAELLEGGMPEARAAEASTDLLEEMLARTGMANARTVKIMAESVPVAGSAADLRDVDGNDALMLEVPDLGPEAGQVVMSVDEAGAITWHFPMDGAQIQPPTVRGAGLTKRFYIRRDVPSTPPTEAPPTRALFGALGRKLLKVLIFPISDALIGKPAEFLAERWESANRAYGIRRFAPADYRLETRSQADRERLALTSEDVNRFARGRALLFIHGAFSSSHGAFHDIPLEAMERLYQRYGGRVFAFNHFTLSHDPRQNVTRLLDGLRQLAPNGRIEIDVICHSRGGLVTRTIAEGKHSFGLDTGYLDVRRVVFAGVPNRGTVLAQADHMIEMIDRLTTVLNLVPPGGVADVFEGILIAVKIIGHGALKALGGLQSMCPHGDFLKQLNAGGRKDSEYFGIAANYEPTDRGLRSIVTRTADAVVDRIFVQDENDLVVPEHGVYETNGSESFPIPADRCLRLPSSAGVMHTDMFGNAQVVRQILAWLS